MPRLVDVHCANCDVTEHDVFVMCYPARVLHWCFREMDELYLPRTRHNSAWSDRDAVVVFRDPRTGRLRYPGQNTVPTPKGYERVVMKSDREVARFEREHHVVNERRHFDGNGRGLDDSFRGKPYN